MKPHVPICTCGHAKSAHGSFKTSLSSASITINGKVVGSFSDLSAESSLGCTSCSCVAFRNRRQQPQRCGNCSALGHKRSTCELSGGGRGPA